MAKEDIPTLCSREVVCPQSLDDSAVTHALPNLEAWADVELPFGRAAIGYVSKIETGVSWGFDGLSSNEQDGQGLSLGVFQWNFGGSAQRLLQAVPEAAVRSAMPNWGAIFYDAIHGSDGLALARSMQTERDESWTFKPLAEEEIRAFLRTPESKGAQKSSAAGMMARARGRATQWSLAARGAAAPTNREITYFLDLQVFSGGNLTGVWAPAAAALRSWFADDGELIAFVSNWLRSCPWWTDDHETGLYGKQDALQSAQTWAAAYPPGTALSDDKALLFAHGFVRALANRGPVDDPDQRKRGIFKAQVLCRHGVTALGIGAANGVGWPGGILDQ
jgi:hypothetical protein